MVWYIVQYSIAELSTVAQGLFMSDLHWSHSVHHDGSSCYVLSNETISLGSTLKLRVRTGLHAPVESIFIRTVPHRAQHMAPLPPIAHSSAPSYPDGAIQSRHV